MNLGRSFVRILTLLVLLCPATAFACECSARASISQRYGYPLVFVGTVTAIDSKSPTAVINPNGVITFTVMAFPEGTVRATVERQFRGPSISEIRIPLAGSDCDPLLAQGQSYLFYDSAGDGSSVNRCNPPVALSEAAEDLKYIEGVRTKQPQAVLYGSVSQEISGIPSQAPGDIVVVMEGGGRQFRQPYSPSRGYQIVVPPGEYRVWVEGQGAPLTAPQTFRLRDGDALRQALTIRR
jgi:hypothetical protein